ncbi:hypothetical protein ABH930_003170 [Kitasatospora sp. GAS204A]|nr:hypothetical protein [Kitasatospora sp. GAS204B]
MAGVSGLLPIGRDDHGSSDLVKPLADALPPRGAAAARGFAALRAAVVGGTVPRTFRRPPESVGKTFCVGAPARSRNAVMRSRNGE